MRQTSQAVALLLALDSAQAAATNTNNLAANPTQVTGNDIYLMSSLNQWQYQTQFTTYGGNTNGDQLNSRVAPYNRCANFATTLGTTSTAPCTAPTWMTTNVAGWRSNKVRESLNNGTTIPVFTSTTATTAAALYTEKVAVFAMAALPATQVLRVSNCVECIQAAGVWCSRTFSYQVSGTVTQVNNATANKAVMASYGTGAFTGATGTEYDNGACCGTTAAASFNGFAAIHGAVVKVQAAGVGNTAWNGWVCPAFANGPTTADDAGKKKFTTTSMDAALFDITNTTAKTSWWCSNGLYSLVPVAGSNIYNKGQLIGDRENNRQELALVGCPQISSCGTKSDTQLTDNSSTAAAAGKTSITVSSLTPDQKCTFVVRTAKGPPAFRVTKPASGPSKVDANWVIHHMEYNGTQMTISASNLYTIANGIDQLNHVPLFTMPNATYNKQRTWYGVGSAAINSSNWSAPYNNFVADATTGFKSVQSWGYVASFLGSTSGTDYDATATKTWDSRQVRYFPAQLAVNSNALGAAIVSQYGTAKAAYDTAKTNWDNYVAILTKNAKVDAFAAAFSPPKAPTVPPLPAQPWLPTAATVATAMSRLSPGQVLFGVVGSGNTAAQAVQPTAANFWASEQAALVAGGWGSFTAATIKYRAGWGKSFGTIGYSDSSITGWNAMGQVYTQAWQCSYQGTTGTTYSPTPTDTTTACPKHFTAISTSAAPAAGQNNAVDFYIAVSVWAVGVTAGTGIGTIFSTTATPTTNSQFDLEFTIGTWSAALQLAAPGAMAAATAASSLTGVAGAHALAASAAATLAAAAALY